MSNKDISDVAERLPAAAGGNTGGNAGNGGNVGSGTVVAADGTRVTLGEEPAHTTVFTTPETK